MGKVWQRINGRLGVRMRSALAAALVVGVASVLTGVAFVVASHLILVNKVAQSTSQRADEVTAAVGETGSVSASRSASRIPRCWSGISVGPVHQALSLDFGRVKPHAEPGCVRQPHDAARWL